MFKLVEGVNKCSNADYHRDISWTSSSGLKKLNEDPAKFYKENVLGERKEEEAENPAFTEGSLTHSLILEPAVVASEYAFFDGLRKSGSEFEAFKAANPGKLIISKPQKARCEQNLRAFKNNEHAVALIKGGEAEHTLAKIWQDMKLKVRCDYINIEQGYIVDVKTSSFSVEVESFKLTVSQFKYDLSAALYCKIAELHYGRPFEFYFIAISKKETDCQVYRMSELTMRRGVEACNKAIATYKKCIETGLWLAPNLTEAEVMRKDILEV